MRTFSATESARDGFVVSGYRRLQRGLRAAEAAHCAAEWQAELVAAYRRALETYTTEWHWHLRLGINRPARRAPRAVPHGSSVQ